MTVTAMKTWAPWNPGSHFLDNYQGLHHTECPRKQGKGVSPLHQDPKKNPRSRADSLVSPVTGSSWFEGVPLLF